MEIPGRGQDNAEFGTVLEEAQEEIGVIDGPGEIGIVPGIIGGGGPDAILRNGDADGLSGQRVGQSPA